MQPLESFSTTLDFNIWGWIECLNYIKIFPPLSISILCRFTPSWLFAFCLRFTFNACRTLYAFINYAINLWNFLRYHKMKIPLMRIFLELVSWNLFDVSWNHKMPLSRLIFEANKKIWSGFWVVFVACYHDIDLGNYGMDNV